MNEEERRALIRSVIAETGHQIGWYDPGMPFRLQRRERIPAWSPLDILNSRLRDSFAGSWGDDGN